MENQEINRIKRKIFKKMIKLGKYMYNVKEKKNKQYFN